MVSALDKPHLFDLMIRAVTALGERQARQSPAIQRLGTYCRLRELGGDRPERVQAYWRRALKRLDRIDAARYGQLPGGEIRL